MAQPDVATDDSAERRAMYRDRLAELAEEHPDASAPELARLLASKLTRAERDAIVADYLSAQVVFAQQFRYMVTRDRTALFKSLDTMKPAPKTATTSPEQWKNTLEDRLSAWREYAPGLGQRAVLDMNGPEIDQAVDYRMNRLMTEYWRTEVMRRLRAGLQNDEEQVKDRYTDDDIAILISTVRKEMQRGNLRLRIQSVPSLPSSFTDARSPRRRNST